MFQQPINQGPGEASFTTHTMEILIMLLIAFLLAWLFWYLWNRAKYMRIIGDLEDQIAKLKAQIASLEAELEECGKSKRRIQLDYDALNVRYQKLLNDQTVDGDSADLTAVKAVPTIVAAPSLGRRLDYNAAFSSDNLQIVEGIGPKIESILKDNKVNSWSALASSSVSSLKGILEAQGPRYRIHDPETWPKQAQLADNDQWDELVEYQKFLGGGRDNSSSVGSGLSKIEKKAVKILGVSLYTPDDLKVVEGIGPKTETLLKENGINNWSELSQTTAVRIQEILDSAGTRFRLLKPDTWPKQAGMAAAGQWKELDEYQDYLQGGKDLAK